jgi:hypothetical protein
MELVKEALFLWALLIAAGAWLLFAEHPTAARLRTAILDTLAL